MLQVDHLQRINREMINGFEVVVATIHSIIAVESFFIYRKKSSPQIESIETMAESVNQNNFIKMKREPMMNL